MSEPNLSLQLYQKEKESKKRWVILGLAFIMNVLTFFDRITLSVATPDMMKEFGWNPAVMGIMLSTFAWTYLLVQIPSGYMVDRFGIRRIFAWSLGLWSLATIATGAVRGMLSLGFCRVLLGLTEGPVYPGFAKLLHIWFNPRERASAMTLLSVAMNIGMAVGVWVAAVIIHHYGWRSMFFFTGVVSLFFIPVWLRYYREFTPFESPAQKVQGPRIRWYHLLKDRNLFSIVMGRFCVTYSFWLFINWLPAYFVTAWGFSLLKTGLFSTVIFVSGLFGKPLLGWVGDHLIKRGWSVTASRKLTLTVYSLLGASIGFAAIAKDPYIAAALLILAEITGQVAGAIAMATSADLAPGPLAAQVGGMVNMTTALAGIIAPILTGIILSQTGSFYWPLMVAALTCFLGAGFFAFGLKKVEPIDVQKLMSKKEIGTSV